MTSVGMMSSGVNISSAGVILLDDCENFTDAPWTTAGSPTIVAGRTGNGFSIQSGASAYWDIPSGNQSDQLVFGAWVKWTAISSSVRVVVQFKSDSGAVSHSELRMFGDGLGGGGFNLCLGSTSLVGTGTVVIHTNAWYRIEFAAKLHDSTGSLEMRIDGVVVATISGTDTKSGGTKSVYDTIYFLGGTGQTWVIDDIYVRNDLIYEPVTAFYLDDFNRANGALGGSWSSGSDGAMEISSNKAIGTSGVKYSRWVNNLGASHWAEADIFSTGGDAAVAVHMNTALNYYYFLTLSGNDIILFRRDSGYTNLGSYNVGTNTGKLRLEANGSSLSGYFNDVLRISATDSSLTEPYAGMVHYTQGGGSTVDNFRCGPMPYAA